MSVKMVSNASSSGGCQEVHVPRHLCRQPLIHPPFRLLLLFLKCWRHWYTQHPFCHPIKSVQSMDVVRITSLQIVLHSGAANTVLPYIRVSARRNRKPGSGGLMAVLSSVVTSTSTSQQPLCRSLHHCCLDPRARQRLCLVFLPC